MEKKGYRGHVFMVPFPVQSHANPMIQLAKRFSFKEMKTTLAITPFIYKAINLEYCAPVQIEIISDGYDQSGYTEAVSGSLDYPERLKIFGSKSLADLIVKHNQSSNPIDCLVYDGGLVWVMDVAKQFGLKAAPYLTQMCAVNYIYYHNFHDHVQRSFPISLKPVPVPGLPLLEDRDLPSYRCFSNDASASDYAAYLEWVLNQFSNIDDAVCILVNTFYKLEDKVVDSMSKVCPLLTTGPTVPSIYMDKSIPDDKNYGISLFELDSSSINWLSSKPPGSVIYVSFGSLWGPSNKLIEEIAWGLKQSNYYFMWVLKTTEEDKLPKEFRAETVNKGLIVNWTPQLEVLSSEAVGCFVTHCGWNSTIEALSLGVPMVAMPQWTDQPTNAKFIEDIWKVGVRVNADNDGIVSREELDCCIRQVMEGERGKEMKENAKKWRGLAIEAISKGGSSDLNIDEFASKITKRNLAEVASP